MFVYTNECFLDYFNNCSSNILFNRYSWAWSFTMTSKQNYILYSDKFSWYGPKGPLIKWTIAPVYISLQDLAWFIDLLSEKWWFVRVQSSIVDHERGIARNPIKREKELCFSNWIFFFLFFFFDFWKYIKRSMNDSLKRNLQSMILIIIHFDHGKNTISVSSPSKWHSVDIKLLYYVPCTRNYSYGTKFLHKMYKDFCDWLYISI